MKRSPELDAMAAADEAEISNRNVKRNQTVGMAALLLAGVFAAYLVLATSGESPPESPQSEEEFRTTTFRPPGFVRDGEPTPPPPEQPVLELPPPPPPPPAPPVDVTEFNVPPPPEVAQPPSAPPPAEEVFPERFRSKLITLDQNQGGTANGSLDGTSSGTPLTVAGEDNSQYLSSASAIGDRSAKARKIERIDAMIPEGTLIPGILETAIVSDLPGQVRAITSKDVYSFDGRRVLIPTGTRLIGEYQSEVTRGQKRVFVVWTRLIRDDGVSVRLNSFSTDSLGRSGLTGHVDNKFRERFGASILLSIVGGGASYLTGYGSNSSSGNDDAERGAELARETIAQTFSDMANTVLAENLRIPPTISVPQGERILVYVRQDLDFSAMYDDPVTEAMKEIRRERYGR